MEWSSRYCCKAVEQKKFKFDAYAFLLDVLEFSLPSIYQLLNILVSWVIVVVLSNSLLLHLCLLLLFFYN